MLQLTGKQSLEERGHLKKALKHGMRLQADVMLSTVLGFKHA